MIENIPDKYIGYTGIQLCLATIHPVLNSPSNNKGKRGENKIWGGGGGIFLCTQYLKHDFSDTFELLIL